MRKVSLVGRDSSEEGIPLRKAPLLGRYPSSEGTPLRKAPLFRKVSLFRKVAPSDDFNSVAHLNETAVGVAFTRRRSAATAASAAARCVASRRRFCRSASASRFRERVHKWGEQSLRDRNVALHPSRTGPSWCRAHTHRLNTHAR